MRRELAVGIGVVVLLAVGLLARSFLSQEAPAVSTTPAPAPVQIERDASPKPGEAAAPRTAVRRRPAPVAQPALDAQGDPEDDALPTARLSAEEDALPPRDRLMRGEEKFSASDLEGAYPYFLSVVESHPDDPLGAFALYKLGWVEWNLGAPDQAMADLKLAAEWFYSHTDVQSQAMGRMTEQDIEKLVAEHPGLATEPAP